MEGTIFDIREFTVHDGPGVRVTVFLKGCPLRCRWCHNPEGLSPKPELMIRTGACTGCNSCKKPCLHPECRQFDRCLHACPDGLISLCGEKISSDMLSQKLLSCAPFLKNGGGVTFSGGEPIMQHDFLYETLTKVKPLHRAVETSGFADPDIFRKVLNECELIMIDLKLASREEHKKIHRRLQRCHFKKYPHSSGKPPGAYNPNTAHTWHYGYRKKSACSSPNCRRLARTAAKIQQGGRRQISCCRKSVQARGKAGAAR